MRPLVDHAIATRYSLLNRLQDWQDGESWQDFFDTYHGLIYSVALRAGLSETEAQEVVQETLICVAKNIHKFKCNRELGSFKGWLKNMTRWRIADQFKKRTRRPGDDPSELEPPEEMPMMADDEGETNWDTEWKEQLLKKAVERVRCRVREEHFQIFDLYALRHWPVKKITQALGVSAPMVYLAKYRVAAMIKKEILTLEKGEC
jgi:RNA polymerase sigma-70 factor (ECF subfamily)